MVESTKEKFPKEKTTEEIINKDNKKYAFLGIDTF
jgi:hypothetical protein